MAGAPITVRLSTERGPGGVYLYEVSGIVSHPVVLDANQIRQIIQGAYLAHEDEEGTVGFLNPTASERAPEGARKRRVA